MPAIAADEARAQHGVLVRRVAIGAGNGRAAVAVVAIILGIPGGVVTVRHAARVAHLVVSPLLMVRLGMGNRHGAL